ncbi:MAG: Mo-dependent nitrogenase C-terminal domain-containing protein [Cyanobacteria bacterium J06621_8]
MNLVQQTFATLHLLNSIKQLSHKLFKTSLSEIDLLSPFRRWLDNIEIKDSAFAHRICRSIPNQCPFEREVKVWGRTLVKIPPMCKINPLYNELVALRFRAICYLADTCGEDVSVYC